MTTVKDWKMIANSMTFMPDVKVEVVEDAFHQDLRLSLRAWVPNSFRPSEKVEVMSNEFVTRDEIEMTSADRIPRRIADFVRKWWLHEFDEWVRFDGWLVNDPHKGQPGHRDVQQPYGRSQPARGYNLSPGAWYDELERYQRPELRLDRLKVSLPPLTNVDV